MARTHLILGGSRSGKSRIAEQLAAQRAPVTYVATAEATDEEMADRIRQHQARRPPDWTTRETADVGATIVTCGSSGTILVDSVTLWISRLLLAAPVRNDITIPRQVEQAIDAARQVAADVIFVSDEVGSGIVPENPVARLFRDVLGEANQRLAEAADTVTFCVAGIGVRIK